MKHMQLTGIGSASCNLKKIRQTHKIVFFGFDPRLGRVGKHYATLLEVDNLENPKRKILIYLLPHKL